VDAAAAAGVAGGGPLMLNGNSGAAIESGDQVGDNNEVKDASDDPFCRPSVLSSGVRELSEHSITSPYSYSSASASMRVFPSTTARPPLNELVQPVD
jgi:hypothetical protein